MTRTVVFIDAKNLAIRWNCPLSSLNRWIKDGTMPPPAMRPGKRKRLWRIADVELAEQNKGTWPEGAWQ